MIYVLLCSEKMYVPSRPVDVNVSLVLGGLHQRSGVALPTGGRADPAIGNEALAGTRYIRYTKTKTISSTLKPRLVEHTHELFFGMDQLEISFRSNNLELIPIRRPRWLGRISSCLLKSISSVQFSPSAYTRRDFSCIKID